MLALVTADPLEFSTGWMISLTVGLMSMLICSFRVSDYVGCLEAISFGISIPQTRSSKTA